VAAPPSHLAELLGSPDRSFWSCFTRATDPLANLYGDVLGRQYEYDSHVVNSSKVAVGDVLVLRDAHLVLGFGVVDAITTRPDVKPMRRCVRCRSADISERKKTLPRFRCNDCKEEFDEPDTEMKAVTVFSASYASWWSPLASTAPVRALDGVYQGRDRQNAIRRLDPVRAVEMLAFHSDVEGMLQLELLASSVDLPGGHVDVVVRQRVGQARFRDAMFARYGTTCAVTGEQPREILDAAHLYSYADRGEHHVDGGMLLRADVHRLFDRLLVTVDPESWRSVVAPPLLDRYPSLAPLHAVPFHAAPENRPSAELLAEHHELSRNRWKDLAKVT